VSSLLSSTRNTDSHPPKHYNWNFVEGDVNHPWPWYVSKFIYQRNLVEWENNQILSYQFRRRWIHTFLHTIWCKVWIQKKLFIFYFKWKKPIKCSYCYMYVVYFSWGITGNLWYQSTVILLLILSLCNYMYESVEHDHWCIIQLVKKKKACTNLNSIDT
jgi:hypothetical protein